MQQIMTRRQAAEAGLKRYYNGRPCSKGHESPRFTSTGACVKCAASYVKEYNSRLKKESNCRAQGVFAYRLHPDDVAAVLAYCQAMDMQRGRAPQAPVSAPVKEEPFVMPADLLKGRPLASLTPLIAPRPGASKDEQTQDATDDHNARAFAQWQAAQK